MGIFKKLGLQESVKGSIDWDITPDYTFTMFESWGGKGERIRNNNERFYYFFVDNWENPAKLCFMERAVKYARVLAWIEAPQELIDRCVTEGGKAFGLDRSYGITKELRQWLIDQVLERDDDSRIHPIDIIAEIEASDSGLPGRDTPPPAGLARFELRRDGAAVDEQGLAALIRAGNFFDTSHNPAGGFKNFLVDNGDGLTVTDHATTTMWQRGGCDISGLRQIRKYIQQLNEERFAGHSDWRLPTLEEAMSLLTQQLSGKGLYLHPCFSKAQPFIFTADWREPGGYWFVDYKQGTAFWASGTIPGGFGRVCRSA